MGKSRTEIQAKYDKKNTRSYTLKLNLSTDKDIIEKLGSVDNMQGYIKEVIRKDIAECD